VQWGERASPGGRPKKKIVNFWTNVERAATRQQKCGTNHGPEKRGDLGQSDLPLGKKNAMKVLLMKTPKGKLTTLAGPRKEGKGGKQRNCLVNQTKGRKRPGLPIILEIGGGRSEKTQREEVVLHEK